MFARGACCVVSFSDKLVTRVLLASVKIGFKAEVRSLIVSSLMVDVVEEFVGIAGGFVCVF
jgi:hypothetical protein